MSELAYDTRTPRTTHEGFAYAMYSDIFANAESIVNVAAGTTDLQGSLERNGLTASVTSVDPMYATYYHRQHKNEVAAYAQDLPFQDESFDMSLCQFGLQHIPTQDIPMAISEMVRVTKTAEDSRDETKGIVIIHPVFKHKQLEVAMKIQGVDPETALLWYADPGKVAPEDRRNAMYPTLIIRKTPALSADKQQRIIDAVISSDALKSRHSVGEWVSRHVFGGYSNV